MTQNPTGAMPSTLHIDPGGRLGRDPKRYALINIYGGQIGDESKIGSLLEIQRGVTIGRGMKVSSHTFIRKGITVEDDYFIGHRVMFTNDKYPRPQPRRRPSNRNQLAGGAHFVRRGANPSWPEESP